MKKYYAIKVTDTITGESFIDDDCYYTNEEDAEEGILELSSNCSAGAEVLELAGRGYTDPDDFEYEIVDAPERKPWTEIYGIETTDEPNKKGLNLNVKELSGMIAKNPVLGVAAVGVAIIGGVCIAAAPEIKSFVQKNNAKLRKKRGVVLTCCMTPDCVNYGKNIKFKSDVYYCPKCGQKLEREY